MKHNSHHLHHLDNLVSRYSVSNRRMAINSKQEVNRKLCWYLRNWKFLEKVLHTSEIYLNCQHHLVASSAIPNILFTIRHTVQKIIITKLIISIEDPKLLWLIGAAIHIYSTKKREHCFSILKAFIVRHSSEYEKKLSVC